MYIVLLTALLSAVLIDLCARMSSPFNQNIFRQKHSIWSVWLVALVLIFQTFAQHKWTTNRVIIHDVTGYYGYLPALFIHHDLDFKFRHSLPKSEPDEGIWVNIEGDTTFLKTGVGMCYFYMPTFLLSHLYTQLSGKHNANGFSEPYQFGMAMNTLIIGLLTLMLMRLILIRFASDTAVAIALPILFLGTNVLYYIAYEPGMTHIYGLFLFCLILLITLHMVTRFNNVLFVLMCFLCGWLIAVRPTNVILLMVPLGYVLHAPIRSMFWNPILKRPALMAGAIVVGLLPLIPQFMYWHQVFGTWISYSYTGERFFFHKPHILDGLFGARTGLFLYTPLLLPGLFGILLLRTGTLRRYSLITLAIYSYVAFSWWCWWYGGYSIRVMIETYLLLGIGLSLLIDRICKSVRVVRFSLLIITLFFMWQNYRFTDLYDRGIIHWDSMTWSNYKAIFWNNNLPSDYFDHFKAPDYEHAIREGEDF